MGISGHFLVIFWQVLLASITWQVLLEVLLFVRSEMIVIITDIKNLWPSSGGVFLDAREQDGSLILFHPLKRKRNTAPPTAQK